MAPTVSEIHSPTNNGTMNPTAVNAGAARGLNTEHAVAPEEETSAGRSSIDDGLASLEGKDPQEQIDALKARLELENRIKDGAENMLQVFELEHPHGKDSLRKQVEFQLAAAKAQISKITRMIEDLREIPGSTKGLRKKAAMASNGAGTVLNTLGRRNFFSPQAPPPLAKTKEDKDGDDFKAALAQANAAIQALVSHSNSSISGPQSVPNTPLSATLSTPQSHSADPDITKARSDIMSKLVTILQRNTKVAHELNVTELIKEIVPALSDHTSKETRTSAYRLIRHLVVDAKSVTQITECCLDWYIVRSLSRDNKHAVEKEQVLKLIRKLVEFGSLQRPPSAGVGSGSVPLSEPIMRALIAVAEHTEDQFKHLSLLTLAEILMVDIDLVSRSGGLRCLLQAMADGPAEVAPILTMAFLCIIDAPRTRAYLKPGLDLEIGLSGFTDAYGKVSYVDKMRSSSKVILVMLRTWSGLMYLCLNDMQGIRSLINTLSIPSLETREVVLDLFFDLLNIKSPEWYQAFIDGRRLTMYGRQKLASAQPLEPEGNKQPDKLNLTHQYLSLLLLVLIEAGLIAALVSVLEESPGSTSNLPRKATLLIGEILQIANKVLPLSLAAEIQSLPQLFSLASDYKEGENRQVATSTFSSIDSFNRNRARLQRPSVTLSRKRANSGEDPMRRGQRQVEQVRVRLGMQIDDKSFNSLLIETQCIGTKDYTKWNFEIINDLIEGPLLNAKRLEEAFKVSRFGRRLFSFFHPFGHQFSDLRRTKANRRYIRMGCSLLTTLIKSSEGYGHRFLEEDPLLKEIADCFSQLDPFNGTPSSDPIFSKRRMEDTLTAGYFEMLGTLSKYPEGIELMERFKLFTAFYHISELRSRDDLIKGIIENIDYTMDGHPRIVLSKALTSSYKHIRLYATQHLGQLIQTTPKANEWTLRLLLTQLYDPDAEVCEMAVHYLEEACEEMDILELVVQMQPTLDHLGETGHPLLLRFMSTAIGFRYLYNTDYIDREMDSWFHERNDDYVVQVEVYLAKAFSLRPEDDDDMPIFDGTVPPHFYGEMAKTALGCQILQEKGHFAEFAHFLRQHGLESEAFDIITKLKSVLWAVGNIGASPGGLPFLDEEEIIPVILEIAEQSLIMSVRGTCFFVLGLISSTPQGAEILDEYGWEAAVTPLGMTTGLCVPSDVGKFVYIPPWQSPVEEPEPPRLPPLEDKIEREVLNSIVNLSNTVIANEAARSLARIKSKHRRLFSSLPLYYRALHTISTQRYRLPVRRYVMELFDVRLDPSVVATLSSIAKSLASAQPATSPGHPPNLARTMSEEEEVSAGLRLGLNGLPDDMASFEEPEVRRKPGPPMKPKARFSGFDA